MHIFRRPQRQTDPQLTGNEDHLYVVPATNLILSLYQTTMKRRGKKGGGFLIKVQDVKKGEIRLG